MVSIINDLSSGKPGYLEGQLLIATPQVTGSCFDKSVVYICIHNDQGAMGIIVNQPIDNMQFDDLLEHLKLPAPIVASPLPIHFGGPVESTRGFVLHSSEYESKEKLLTHGDLAVTSSINILKDIAAGNGPKNSMLVLGYAGWTAGQLEAEIEANGWITVPATSGLIFDTDNDTKWEQAGSSLGFDLFRLSMTAGHA